ncbi:LptA/OstA family protein [Kiritimatiellota bacterium B12222]|nr:LptA/OstA family protein [Kiritimatiellota bacterium B12222]
MNKKPHFSLFLALFLALFVLPNSLAQTSSDLQVEADSLNYEAEGNLVTAKGNVFLRKGAQSLKADIITYNQVTEQAFARGNVVFTNADQIWEGDTLKYNFITGKGSFPNLNMESGPFKLKAENIERLGPLQTKMTDVTVTTCPEITDPDFAIRASNVDVYEEDLFVMHNPVFYLHGVPFFYLPRLTLDKQRKPTNIDVVPGYSSRDGFMLLTSYSRYPSDSYRTKTILDYRSERGFAAGQNFYWYNPETNTDHTTLKFYGALDQQPYRNEKQEEEYLAQGIDIPDTRYRIKFDTRQSITPTDTFWAKASYLSDAKVVEDFFSDEYRIEPIPETRMAYSAIGQGWNANIDVTRQLNQEEFNAVNRLPEATFNVPLLKMGSSEFLYESETRAGYLERTFSSFNEENGYEGYDSLRLDTKQMVSYPTRSFGWLNIVPRAGGRITYYSNTKGSETQIVPVSTADENNVITTVLETNNIVTAEAADVRVLPEIGFETSFKAFGLVHDQPTRLGKGLRNVIEPFANYTYIPEPDLVPADIYQFDTIDTLSGQNNMRFGVRTKWQTQAPQPNGRHSIQDLVNLSVSTAYDLSSDADPALSVLEFDTEFTFVEWAYARIDFEYDTDESQLDTLTAEMRFIDEDTGNRLSLYQRYRAEDVNTSQLDYAINPRGRLGFEGYTRYEFESEGFEEQHIMFTIKTECIGYGIGGKWLIGDTYSDGSHENDTYEVWFQFWLTAFPRAIVGTR